MKTFRIWISYDAGGSEEFELEAASEQDAYQNVYAELGYDPGEVCVEEISV